MNNTEIKYTGHKNINGVYQAIINEIPIITDFYELFCGSCHLSKILLSITTQVNYHINDLSSGVIDKYNFTSAITTTFDAIDIINNINDYEGSNKLIFLDPPYIHASRPNNTNIYEFEMSDLQHLKLFQSIIAANVKIILIHPKGYLYDELINLGWRYKEVSIRYHNKTSIERIYMNYEVPSNLLTYQFLGFNFTDRQRIKRKCIRFSQKLLLLPVLERLAIIEYINNNCS